MSATHLRPAVNVRPASTTRTSAQAVSDEPVADPRRWLALALLAAAQFMVVLDASIVNIALPSIGSALHFSQSNLPWVVNAYILAFGGLLLLGGRAADLLGRRRVFIAALGLFSLASLAGGLAQSSWELIAARVAQGMGAAALAPAALSLVTQAFQHDQREKTKALSIWGAVAGSGAAIGVLLGGVLTSGLGWRWVLFVNVPVGLLAAVLAPRVVRESRAETTTRSFDIGGGLTVTGGLTALVYALIRAQSSGWTSLSTLAMFTAAATLLAAFAVIESRVNAPLVPFRIFRLRTISGANAVALLSGAALISMFFFLSLYLQQVLGYSAIKTGLVQLPLAGGIILAAGVASPLIDKLGTKNVIAAGLATFMVGLVWLAQAGVEAGYGVDLLGPFLLIAFALGLVFVPMTVASVSGIDDSDYGLASGLINTTQQIGGAIGLAIAATIATTRTDHVLAQAHHAPSAMPQALTSGFQRGYLVGVGFAALGLIAALVLFERSRHGARREAALSN
jgi:EmrB/QacA subfamily drug resistance transporter